MTKKKKAAKKSSKSTGRTWDESTPEAELLAKLEGLIAMRTQTVADFATRLATKLATEPENVWSELERADPLFEEAADLTVYVQTRRALTASDSLTDFESIREYAIADALKRSRRAVSRSTSPSVDLIQGHLSAAWASLVEQLFWIKPPKSKDA